MKKSILLSALTLSFLLPVLAFPLPAAAAAEWEATKLEDITLRDPFVLVCDGKYYLYGTGAASGPGYGCYTSNDLENWSGPQNVFTAPEDFDGVGCFWAPECHFYSGSFYLFATYLSKNTGHRGVSIFRSDRPDGGFEEISTGHLTPHGRDSIDGTLYVDKSGRPWMVYIDEWTGTEDGVGRIDAARLSDDLSSFVSEPVELFRADSPLWSDSGVTDGPFLYTAADGSLIMLWSSFNESGYCVGTAKSSNGEADGKWIQSVLPLYQKSDAFAYDGGHAMIFTALDGRRYLSLHTPNGSTEERHTGVLFLEVNDSGGRLTLAGTDDSAAGRIRTFFRDAALFLKYLFARVGAKVVNFFKSGD